MVRQTIYTGDDFTRFKCKVKVGNRWVDYEGDLFSNAVEDKYPTVRPVAGETLFLYYDMPLPIRTSNFTLWFGTEASKIRYGLYDTESFEPFVEYDKGYVEVNGYTAFFPNNMRSGSHWFNLHFNDPSDEIIFQTGKIDGVNTPETVSISESELDTNNLCYIGVMYTVGNNDNWDDLAIWIERLRVYYTKIATSAEITFDKDGFFHPAPVTGTVEIVTEFGNILDNSDVSLTYTQDSVTRNVQLINVENNTFTFIDVPEYNTKPHNYTVQFQEEAIFESSNTSSQTYYRDYAKIILDEERYIIPENGSVSIRVKLLFADGNGEYTLTNPLKYKYPSIARPPVLIEIFDKTGNRISNGVALADGNSDEDLIYDSPEIENRGTYTITVSFLGELLEKTADELMNYTYVNVDGVHRGFQEPIIASMASYNQRYTNNISKSVPLLVGGDNEAVITLDIGDETQYYPNEVTLTCKALDLDDNPIKNKPLNIIVDSEIIDTINLDNSGNATYSFIPTPLNGKYHRIYVELDDEDGEYFGESPICKLYYINKSRIVVDSSSLNQNKNVFQTAKIKFRVYDSANHLVNDGDVNIIVHDKYDEWIIFQEAGFLYNGVFEETFVNSMVGDIDSIVSITFEGNENVAGTKGEFKIHWNRLESVISMTSGEYIIEALETNKCVFSVKSELDAIISYEQISIITEFLTTDYELIEGMDDEPYFPALDKNGTATVSYTATKGDIYQKIIVTYGGNSLYRPHEHTFFIRWKKIATEITANDVTHYSGRYTLIDEGVEQEPSPGTNSNYNNFRSKVTVVSHSKVKVVNDGFVSWRDVANELLNTNVAKDGSSNGRYTRTVDKEKTTTVKAEYYGTDIFAPCSVNITLKTLLRVNPSLVLSYVHPYNAPFRYNIPFVIEATLKENTTPLKNYSLKCYVADTLHDTKTTNNEGKVSFKQYNPTIVGKLKVDSRFNENDLIDKYNPTTSSQNITIDKDYTFLTMKTGTNTYTSCGDALINLTLTDSIKRGIADAVILLKYDDGSYNTSPTWQNIENLENPTTNSTGKASVNIEAYSGIRLVQGTFEETWCYYSISEICEVIYEISRVYTANINQEGIAEIPVDCYLDATKGLPNGLYDVILEYIPPETETGKCPLYGNSTSKEAMRKKRARNLRCLTEYLVTEAHMPIFLTTELTNIKNKPQVGIKELSKVNGGNSSEPLHITDENGQIVRGACTGIIGNTLHFYFFVDQSRKNIGAKLMVDVMVTKMTPILEVTHELTGYSGVKMNLTARLYNTFKKYDKYGQEIHINDNNDLLYYNPISDKYYNIKNEGEENEERISITKAEYTNASPILTIEPLPNRTVIWYGIDGKTELVRATTNEEGIATAQYARISIGTVTITARTEEERDYYGRTESITIHTLDREQPYFEEIDFDEKDDNGNYTKSTIYDHPTKLYTWLYIDVNGVKTPFANQTVEFRQSGNILGTGTTNNQGYVEITKTVKNTLKYPYEAYFASKDKYKSATKVYRIHVEKQTPILTLQANKTTANLRDTVTLTAKLTEDTLANKAPMINRGITFLDNDKGFAYNTTDYDGISMVAYEFEHAGQRTIKAMYNTENDAFNPVETTITINVNKMNTYFEGVVDDTVELAGLTSTEVKIYLKNAKNEKLLSKNVTITYNDKTWNGKTDGQGAILIHSSSFEKDVIKTAHIVFNGDDNYNGCTYDLTFKWGEYENTDNCKDLNTFEAIPYDWYASMEDVTGIPGTAGKGSCRLYVGGRYVYNYYCLRKVCNDLKKIAEYDEESGQVAVPTGIILRNKNLVTTSKCTIKFYFKMKYDGVSNGVAPRLYGGHLGLMSKTAIEAESAPARFEFYRNNSYFISGGGKDAVRTGLAYSIVANEEYCVEMKINGLKINMTWYDSKGKKLSTDSQTAKGVSSLAGLYLYAFVFTNGTKFVLNGLELNED